MMMGGTIPPGMHNALIVYESVLDRFPAKLAFRVISVDRPT
jgi:hypothetical protein